MDHLGVEVEDTDLVPPRPHRLADAGLATRIEDNTTCCYAVQDKVWVTGPGNEPWEVYTVTDDARADLEGTTSIQLSSVGGDGTCCATATDRRHRHRHRRRRRRAAYRRRPLTTAPSNLAPPPRRGRFGEVPWRLPTDSVGLCSTAPPS